MFALLLASSAFALVSALSLGFRAAVRLAVAGISFGLIFVGIGAFRYLLD